MKQELFDVETAAGILRYSPGKLLWLCHTAQIDHVYDKHGNFAFRWSDIAHNMIDRTRKPASTRRNFGSRGAGQ